MKIFFELTLSVLNVILIFLLSYGYKLQNALKISLYFVAEFI